VGEGWSGPWRALVYMYVVYISVSVQVEVNVNFWKRIVLINEWYKMIIIVIDATPAMKL
jgi:hypothetical protein